MDIPREYVVLRVARVLLACWWIIAPVVLGYWGTFAQRQDIVVGLLVLPMMIVGLVIGGARIFLLIAGCWLILSPYLSGQYYGTHAALVNDVVTGVLAVILSIVPLWMPRREEVIDVSGRRVAVEHAPGFFRRHRHVTLRA